MFVRQPYAYDVDAASMESGLECPEKSLVKQEFAEESDINTIVRRFGLTGQLPENVRMPESVDVMDAMSYQEAMNAVVAARESFDKMPADVRARFANDPMKFADWAADDANFAEASKLGLVKAEAVTRRATEAAAARKAELDAAVAAELAKQPKPA